MSLATFGQLQGFQVVADFHRVYEIRCPLHGFITITDWEREIINTPAFQRLRRIRQLAWTDQVYPGAMHTRFEHSLGVLHVASRLFDAIVERSRELLRSELAYTDEGLKRERTLVRLTAPPSRCRACAFLTRSRGVVPLHRSRRRKATQGGTGPGRRCQAI